MSKFIKFLSRAHFNFSNVSLNENPDGTATLRAENVVNFRTFGQRGFKNSAAAEKWWDDLPGSGLGKLQNALENLHQS